MNNKYKILLKNNKVYNCDIKEVLKKNPKLILMEYDKELYSCCNIQSLYLYPLSIIDYIDNLNKKNILHINIIDIDTKINYRQLLSEDIYNSVKAVEILIKDNYNAGEIKQICEIIECLLDKRVLITLNIKKLSHFPKKLCKYIKVVKYIKIFMNSDIDQAEYFQLLENLSIIEKKCSKGTLVHIKTYLNLSKIALYESMIKDFSEVGIDIFQISKELLDLNSKNIMVSKDNQKIIRNLEEKYNKYDKCKFISVKDLSTLYYPRFELDDRNSKVCYVAKMKPYLYKGVLLPCKVSKIMSNIDMWALDYKNKNNLGRILKRCGSTCDDCASIFENDLLYDIESIILKHKCDIILKEQ